MDLEQQGNDSGNRDQVDVMQMGADEADGNLFSSGKYRIGSNLGYLRVIWAYLSQLAVFQSMFVT